MKASTTAAPAAPAPQSMPVIDAAQAMRDAMDSFAQLAAIASAITILAADAASGTDAVCRSRLATVAELGRAASYLAQDAENLADCNREDLA